MAYPIQLVGYHAPMVFQLDGVYVAHPVSVAGALNGGATAAIGGAAGAGFFGGFKECPIGLMLDLPGSPVPGVSLTIRHRIAGAAATTDVELYRLRAGIWTLLCAASLAVPAGAGGAASASVVSFALATITPGDVLACILTAVQTVTAADLTATVTFG